MKIGLARCCITTGISSKSHVIRTSLKVEIEILYPVSRVESRDKGISTFGKEYQQRKHLRSKQKARLKVNTRRVRDSTEGLLGNDRRVAR